MADLEGTHIAESVAEGVARRLAAAIQAFVRGDGNFADQMAEAMDAYDAWSRSTWRRLDPNMPAPPLEGGDWGFEPYEDVLDGLVADASDLSDGAE